MITNLQYLGIYSDAIDKAIGVSEQALKQENFTEKEIREFHDMASEELKSCGNWDDITNSIILAYFVVAADMIGQKRKEAKPDYYVNCSDSHFYIDGNEISLP